MRAYRCFDTIKQIQEEKETMKWFLTFIDEVFVQYIFVLVYGEIKTTKNKKKKLTKTKDILIIINHKKYGLKTNENKIYIHHQK